MNSKDFAKLNSLVPGFVDIKSRPWLEDLEQGVVLFDGDTMIVVAHPHKVHPWNRFVAFYAYSDNSRKIFERDCTGCRRVINPEKFSDVESYKAWVKAEEFKRRYLPADLTKWQQLGLCPIVGGQYLAWKHVRAKRALLKELSKHADHYKAAIRNVMQLPDDAWIGNLGAPYQLNKPVSYQDNCNVTAGPIGAIRDWASNDNAPHFGAILAPILYEDSERSIWKKSGVFNICEATLIGVYRVKSITRHFDGGEDEDHSIDYELVEGVDAMSYLG